MTCVSFYTDMFKKVLCMLLNKPVVLTTTRYEVKLIIGKFDPHYGFLSLKFLLFSIYKLVIGIKTKFWHKNWETKRNITSYKY